MNSVEFVVRGPGVAVFVDGIELARDDGVPPYAGLIVPELEGGNSRLHVRMCSCGELGCWSLAARVSRDAGRIVWDGWQECVDESGLDGEPVERPTLEFEAAPYRAAVRRLLAHWRERK